MSKDRNSFPARTNQKLYFARLQLDLMQAALAADDFAAEPRAMACREAAIWHLDAAVGAFMQELSRFYKVQPPVSTPEALTTVMAGQGRVSPEAGILAQLLADPASWYSQLRRLLAACHRPVELPDIAIEAADPARIAIPVRMTDSDLPLTEADQSLLQDIHHKLTQAIRDFRAELVEF